MRKILVVLVLLLVASLAYSVGGSMYMRYNANGTVTATEWGVLDDLRVSRRGTGFDLNFDTFTFSYKLRSPITINPFGVGYGTWEIVNAGGGVAKAYGTPFVSNYMLTSPGYIQFSGLKLGPVTVSIGGSWWHFGESGINSNTSTGISTTTNIGGVSTNLASTNVNASVAVKSTDFELFALNFTMNLPLGDTMRLHIDPWDQLDAMFGFGGAANASGSTNSVLGSTNISSTTASGASLFYRFIIPVHLNMDLGQLGLEIFPKITIQGRGDGYADVSSSYDAAVPAAQNSTVTNVDLLASSAMIIGVMGRVNYLINEVLSAYAHIGFVLYNTATVSVSATTTTITTNGLQSLVTNIATIQTNEDSTSSVIDLPIFAGLKVSPAGPVSLNLGVGYLLKISSTTVNKPSSSSSVSTNTSGEGGGLVGEYGYFDEHGYQNPFLRFAGSAKFASDWEIGMSTIVYWSQKGIATAGASGSYYTASSSTGNTHTHNSPTGYSDASSASAQNSSQLLHFDYFNDWDRGGNGFGANYLQFSKDNVTIRGHIDGGSGLWGLFGFADVSFAF